MLFNNRSSGVIMKKIIAISTLISFVGYLQANESMDLHKKDIAKITISCMKQQPSEMSNHDVAMAEDQAPASMAKTGNDLEQAMQNQAASLHAKDQEKPAGTEPKNMELEKQQPDDEDELSFFEEFEVEK